VRGILLVVSVEAPVEVADGLNNDSFSSLDSTNPGVNIFDTSSAELGKTDIPLSLIVEKIS